MRAHSNTFSCLACGSVLVRKPGPGRNPRFCDDRCRYRFNNPAKTDEEKLAARAIAMTRNAPGVRSENARVAAKARWAALSPEDRSAAASSAARARYGEGYVAKPVPTRRMRACSYCGAEVMMTSVQASCRSNACRLAHNAARNRKHASARRAIIRGVESEVFEPLDIFERDSWKCQLCGDAVDRKLRWPDPMSASLDHIVPLSRGGVHIPSNTQCSHLVCNVRRGNRFQVT